MCKTMRDAARERELKGGREGGREGGEGGRDGAQAKVSRQTQPVLPLLLNCTEDEGEARERS